MNFADLSRALAIPQTTLKRYVALLETTFLVRLLPAWFANVGKRLTKAPKLLLTDTGLLMHVLGADSDRLHSDRLLFGVRPRAGELRRHGTDQATRLVRAAV